MEAVFMFFQLFGKNQNGCHSATFGPIDLRIETYYLTDKGHVQTEYLAKRLKNVIMEAVFMYFQLFGKMKMAAIRPLLDLST